MTKEKNKAEYFKKIVEKIRRLVPNLDDSELNNQAEQMSNMIETGYLNDAALIAEFGEIDFNVVYSFMNGRAGQYTDQNSIFRLYRSKLSILEDLALSSIQKNRFKSWYENDYLSLKDKIESGQVIPSNDDEYGLWLKSVEQNKVLTFNKFNYRHCWVKFIENDLMWAFLEERFEETFIHFFKTDKQIVSGIVYKNRDIAVDSIFRNGYKPISIMGSFFCEDFGSENEFIYCEPDSLIRWFYKRNSWAFSKDIGWRETQLKELPEVYKFWNPDLDEKTDKIVKFHYEIMVTHQDSVDFEKTVGESFRNRHLKYTKNRLRDILNDSQ